MVSTMTKEKEKVRDLKKVSLKFSKALKHIKVLLFDVDGVLTNGLIYYDGAEVGFNRYFHAHDGYGIKMMREAGLRVGIVSGGHSVGLLKRAEYLKLDYCFTGNEDKRVAFLQVMKDGFAPEQILYFGDEIFDIPLMKKAGFSATTPQAPLEVKEVADYVTEKNGGEGAAREVIDLLRYAQKITPQILDFSS